MKHLLIATALVFVFSAAADGVLAAKCHNSKTGKFIKCPAAAVVKAQHCKDPKSHKFVKCTAPGAVPA